MPPDCLMSYSGHSLVESYSSEKMQWIYSTAPADWATGHSLVGSYPSTKMQLVYSIVPADCWIKKIFSDKSLFFYIITTIEHVFLSVMNKNLHAALVKRYLHQQMWPTFFPVAMMISLSQESVIQMIHL